MIEPHTCPECRDGKHRACNGQAWCLIEDAPVACTCDHQERP